MFIKATASHNLCAILLYHTKGTYSRISSKTSTFSRVRSASRAYGGRAASFRAYGGRTASFRAYGGRTASFRAYGGRTASFRAYGGRTASFRAYGGRTASFRAYGVPYENGQQGICFPLHIGSPTEAHRKKLVFLFTGKIPIEARRTFHKDKPHPIRP